jgi:putative ABC transport system substrate-binding protein
MLLPGGVMRRREFLGVLSGVMASGPLAARAQQRMRRVGMLNTLAADDPESSLRIAAFAQGLQQLGWTSGGNVRIDYRWGANDADRVHKAAGELLALSPDVILTSGASTIAPFLRVTRTVPLVFVMVVDPVGAGFVASLSRPGGNATGFTVFEYGISGKWLELLKQIAPNVTRAAIIRDPSISAGTGQFGAIQAVAPSLGIEVLPVNVSDAGEIGRAVADFARTPNGGLVLTGSALAYVHRELIVALTARHRLPAVYNDRVYVSSGGLISYGPDRADQYRQAASYVDRILKGEKPADLPVQNPTKFELAINLTTAKALHLTVPPTLLARADEVIE